MVAVHPIDPPAWQAYRDVRLRALRDAPDAFGSTYAAEVTASDESWSARIAHAAASGQGQGFVARDQEQVCGLVWCALSAEDPGMAQLYQMWVDPAVRGRGVGRALLGAALTWAGAAQAERVRLGVTAGDSPARRLYQALGFRAVGPLVPLRQDCALMVQSMELALPRPRSGAVSRSGSSSRPRSSSTAADRPESAA